MVNCNIFSKGTYPVYWESCIYTVTSTKIFYFITCLFHYTGTLITQCQRHWVILYQSDTSCQLKNIQRIYGGSHNLYNNFIFIWLGNKNFIYGNLDFLRVFFYLSSFHFYHH